MFRFKAAKQDRSFGFVLTYFSVYLIPLKDDSSSQGVFLPSSVLCYRRKAESEGEGLEPFKSQNWLREEMMRWARFKGADPHATTQATRGTLKSAVGHKLIGKTRGEKGGLGICGQMFSDIIVMIITAEFWPLVLVRRQENNTLLLSS